MKANNCISTSSAATAKKSLTINDLDDDSLGMIFNKLPYIDRTHIESVSQRWYDVSKANWSIYSKHLRIGVDTGDFPSPCDYTTEKKNILEEILQRASPYLEEITFKMDYIFCQQFPIGTIKWIIEQCPKLKRLNTSYIKLNNGDWLACRNLEAFSFSFADYRDVELDILFRNNKRLHRLAVYDGLWLVASHLDHLDPGQLKFLHIENCLDFEFTTELADKLAESLVELTYGPIVYTVPNFLHLSKLKNLRSLDLRLGMIGLKIEIITEIIKNCWKLEYLFLVICFTHVYDQNVFEPLFNLPYLKRFIIIVEENAISYEERDRLLQRAAHLEFFVIDTCDNCSYGTLSSKVCDRHPRGWLT